ncbi:DoxX family protein [Nocardia sp. NPDC127579]|uniref:DoxX family protein n=1 Tax=Nocardia sp. NPDC127579 TaxID=3345402 RepID=UPI0036415E02
MTDKPKDTPGDSGTAAAGRGVGSPYDSPTGQFPRVGMSKDVPRTEEELGLDPDVPTVGEKTAPYSYASIPAAAAPGGPSSALRRRAAENRRGTLDFGLFVLRLVVGATFLYHGLQKLTGWFHGPGFDGTRDMMTGGGWDHATLSAVLLTTGEVLGGALLVLGLATPLAAGSVLAVILNAWLWKQGMIPGFQYSAAVKSGVEMDSILLGASAAIILTGPGRWSLDRARGWAIRPAWGSFVVLLVAVAVAILTFWFLHGGNPLTGIGPFD